MSGLRGAASRPGRLRLRLPWRMLSALAGGGLTIAGLGGPLAGGALGAESPTGSTTTGAGAEPPATSTTPETGASTTGSSTTSTSTTPSTAPSTTSTSAPTTPTSTTPTPAPATPAPAGEPAGEGLTVLVRHKQQSTPSRPAGSRNLTHTKAKPTGGKAKGPGEASTSAGTGAPNNVALPPQLVADQAGALAAILGSEASGQGLSSLNFYRVPLFLLPIYRAAATQYDVPWPVLAAINEIETDYGTDLSVSSAGAEGWMQFEPGTWLQYGVDALNAGYADPYNPVDAIFAAARYLNAAGAAHNLSAAILAYNHSEAYVELGAAAGEADRRLSRSGDRDADRLGRRAPAGHRQAHRLERSEPVRGGATAVDLQRDRGRDHRFHARVHCFHARVPWLHACGSCLRTCGPCLHARERRRHARHHCPYARERERAATPGSSAAPSPATAASAASTAAASPRLVDVTSELNARAVAVQDGRIVKLGYSRKLGKYVVLQDVYGDVFTYAGLGSIARSYELPKSDVDASASLRGSGSSTRAGAGRAGGASTSEPARTGAGKVRVFAHPGTGNQDARAAIAGARASAGTSAGGRLPLRSGSIVAQNTVLGRVSAPAGARDGHLRFAIRPAGDSSTIDPRAILANWTQLDAALHPRGAKGNPNLLGATASDVFLLSKSQLEREVLSDPGVALSACSRHEVASGAIDKRALAVLAFLSRSGLKPTVGTLRCGAYAAAGYVSAGHAGDAVAIVAINGVPIAGHQGAGSITDTTIRTLLTLQGEFAPARIVSLMRYPGAPTTLARADHGDYVEIVFAPTPAHAPRAKPAAARAAGAGAAAPAPGAIVSELSAAQWEQLVARIDALPAPTVAVKPSSAAIPDHTSPQGSQAASAGSGPGSGPSSSGG